MRLALIGSIGFAAACQAVSGLSSLETADQDDGGGSSDASAVGDGAKNSADGNVQDARVSLDASFDGGADADAADDIDTAPRGATCLEAQSHGVTKDREVLIDADGAGPLKPFTVYCFGMQGSSPQAYLSLKHSVDTGEPTSNVSFMPFDINSCGYGTCALPGHDLQRYHTKVRIDLASLSLDSTDLQFGRYDDKVVAGCWASTGGACYDLSQYMYWGRAAGCGSATKATANMDLRDTGFAFDPSVSVTVPPQVDGPNVHSNATFNADRTTLDVQEWLGSCGWASPTGGYSPAHFRGPDDASVPQYQSVILTKLKQL